MLQQILSFLPTKEVVATCLLSKRWRSLWLSMSFFDFHDATFKNLDDFFLFIDAVLFLVDSKAVEKFRFRCGKFRFRHDRRSVSKINIWINTLINRKVERLELCSSHSCIDVTSRIFNCNTIRVLKLDGVSVNIPSSVKLPSLKVLHLVVDKLPDDECLANLFSGCALLEELVLGLMRIDEEVVVVEKDFTVNWNIEKLEHLVSANVPSLLITSKVLTNVTLLWLNVDWSSPVRDIPTFDNLTHLEISCLEDEHLNWMVKCLRSYPKLDILVINEIYVDTDTEEAFLEPTLDVHQCLSSHLQEFTLGGYEGWECELEIARYIMKNARVLRTIAIFCGDIDSNENYEYLNELASCPRASEHCRLLFK